MPAITPSQRLRILIGADQQDWSDAYTLFEANYESLGDSSDLGLIKVLGTLTISNIYTNPESLNPRVNPTRWRPGTPVYVQARNDADTAWLDTWFSRLRILEEPAAPGLGSLTVGLGCLLAWSDTFQLDADKSGVSFGTAETTDQIAARLLQASDIPASNISLSTWPYSLAYPFGKDTDSFTGKAGELAYSNDWRYLYQNTAGNITDGQLSLTPSSPIAMATIGQNDIVWEPLPDPQQPPELTKVAGIGYDLSTAENPRVVVVPVEGNFADYDPNAAGQGVIERTTTTDSFNAGDPNTNPVAAPTKTNRVHVFSIEALIFQNPGIPTQLVEYTDKVTIRTYETGFTNPIKQAKLVSVVETFRQREKSIIADGEFLNMRTLKVRRSDYSYDANDAISRIATAEEEAEIVYDELSANPWNLRPTLAENFRWAEYAPGRYDREDVVSRALITDRSDIDKATQNIWSSRTETIPYDRSEPNTPPATEYFDGGISEAEVHYEGTASFIHPGGPTGRNRERLYTVAFGFSNAQVVGMAIKHRNMLHGRHRADLVRLAINDTLLTTPPLPEIHVTYQEDTFKYLGDSLGVSFEGETATAECHGIWIDGGYEQTVFVAEILPSLVDNPVVAFPVTNAEILPALLDNSLSGVIVNSELLPALLDNPVVTQPTPVANAEILPAFADNPIVAQPTPVSNAEILPALVDAPITVGLTPVSNAEILPALEDNPDVDTDAQDYIAALSGTYSAPEEAGFETFFETLKTLGIYNKFAVIKFLSGDAISDTLVNMITATSTGSNNNMTFTPRQGLAGNGSNSYIATGFNPVTTPGIFNRNSAHVSIYNRTNSAEAKYDIGSQNSGGASATYAACKWSDNTHYAEANSSGSNWTNASVGNPQGHWVTTRTTSNLISTYQNKILQDTNSANSVAVADNEFVVGALSTAGTITNNSAREYAIYSIGAGLTATEVSDFNDAVEALLTVFGANV